MARNLFIRAGEIMLVMTAALPGAGAPASLPEALPDYFEGNWSCTGRFLPSGRPIASTMSFRTDPGTGVIVKTHADRPPAGYHALELWSTGPGEGAYRAAIADREAGMRWYRSEGWTGRSLTWQRADMAGAGRDEFRYTAIDRTTMDVTWSIDRDGKGLVPGDTLSCRKG